MSSLRTHLTTSIELLPFLSASVTITLSSVTHLTPRGLKKLQPPKSIKTCNYRKLDQELLHKLMTNDALEHITHMRNLDNSVESFTHLITAVINKVLPEKTLRVKQNSLPWAREPEVCEARIKRNLAHWKAIKCNTPEAWSNYRKLRNKAILLCSGLPNPLIIIIWPNPPITIR